MVTASGFNPPLNISGSVDPADTRARLRTPVEVGWTRAVKFDHDFIGRAALEEEVADPRRTIATLRWNPERRPRHPRVPAAARRGVQDHRPPDLAALDARA